MVSLDGAFSDYLRGMRYVFCAYLCERNGRSLIFRCFSIAFIFSYMYNGDGDKNFLKEILYVT